MLSANDIKEMREKARLFIKSKGRVTKAQVARHLDIEDKYFELSGVGVARWICNDLFNEVTAKEGGKVLRTPLGRQYFWEKKG